MGKKPTRQKLYRDNYADIFGKKKAKPEGKFTKMLGKVIDKAKETGLGD